MQGYCFIKKQLRDIDMGDVSSFIKPKLSQTVTQEKVTKNVRNSEQRVKYSIY